MRMILPQYFNYGSEVSVRGSVQSVGIPHQSSRVLEDCIEVLHETSWQG
jgi:hypothetical protein